MLRCLGVMLAAFNCRAGKNYHGESCKELLHKDTDTDRSLEVPLSYYIDSPSRLHAALITKEIQEIGSITSSLTMVIRPCR